MGQGHRRIQACLGHVDLCLCNLLLGAPAQQLGRVGFTRLNGHANVLLSQGQAGGCFQSRVGLAHQLLQCQLRRLSGTVKLDAFGNGLLKTRRSQHLIGQWADLGRYATLDQLQQLAVFVLGFTGHVQTLMPAQHFKKLLSCLLHQAVACFLQARLNQRELGQCQTILGVNFSARPKRLLHQQGPLRAPTRSGGFGAHGGKARPLGGLQIGLRRLHLGLLGFHARVVGCRQAQGIGQF